MNCSALKGVFFPDVPTALKFGCGLSAMIGLLIAGTPKSAAGWAVQGFIAAAAYLPLSWEVIVSAVRGIIKNRRFGESFLMSSATFGAFALGELPEAIAVMLFYQIGERFEAYAQGRARGEIASLASLRPSFARVIGADGSETLIKPRKANVGSVIRILPGETVPIDGVLESHSASCDMSPLTGESVPESFAAGDHIPSGVICAGTPIEIRTSCEYKDSSVARLLNLIEDAAASKSQPERLISKFAGIYTPAVTAMAVLLALVPLFFGCEWREWLERALVFLVVSCPCALVLSVPLSFFGGIGAASKAGILIKGSLHIETLSKVSCFAFDKTGTITDGVFAVKSIELARVLDQNAAVSRETVRDEAARQRLLGIAAALESSSVHPVARAICAKAAEMGSKKETLSGTEELSGMGIRGNLPDGKSVLCGRWEFLHEQGVSGLQGSDDVGSTCVFVSLGGEYLGCIKMGDAPRPSAKTAIKELADLGIGAVMITGDRHKPAEDAAALVGITDVRSGRKPGDKLEELRSIKNSGHVIGYLGDGINDAPALGFADIGMSMGQFGSAAAVEASDAVVLSEDLRKIPLAVRISKKTHALAVQNIILSLGIKIAVLILGALGFAGIWAAVFGDVGALVICVLNAMRSFGFAEKSIRAQE